MGYKLVKKEEPKKQSFFKEHKETIIIMSVGFLTIFIIAGAMLLDRAYDKAKLDAIESSAAEEVKVSNPYKEGEGEYYAFMAHEKEVTAVMEMEPEEDGTKVWYVAFVDGWTAFVYLEPDGNSYIKIEQIP